jgi:hypothetical protein
MDRTEKVKTKNGVKKKITNLSFWGGAASLNLPPWRDRLPGGGTSLHTDPDSPKVIIEIEKLSMLKSIESFSIVKNKLG